MMASRHLMILAKGPSSCFSSLNTARLSGEHPFHPFHPWIREVAGDLWVTSPPAPCCCWRLKGFSSHKEWTSSVFGYHSAKYVHFASFCWPYFQMYFGCIPRATCSWKDVFFSSLAVESIKRHSPRLWPGCDLCFYSPLHNDTHSWGWVIIICSNDTIPGVQNFLTIVELAPLPKTKSSPLNISGWMMNFLFGARPIFRGDSLFSLTEGMFFPIEKLRCFFGFALSWPLRTSFMRSTLAVSECWQKD